MGLLAVYDELGLSLTKTPRPTVDMHEKPWQAHIFAIKYTHPRAPDMTDITASRDCGNSPKNQFAEQIVIALETGNTAFLSDALDKGVVWETAGGEVTGCEPVLAQVAQAGMPSQLRIDHVVTHGKAGAVNGVANFKGVGRVRRFCHVLTFVNTKCQTLRRIISFSD